MIDIHQPNAGLDYLHAHVALLFVIAVTLRIAIPIYLRRVAGQLKLMRRVKLNKFHIDPVTEYLVTKKRPVSAIYAGPERRKRA